MCTLSPTVGRTFAVAIKRARKWSHAGHLLIVLAQTNAA
jgi:hypothetical protein